MQLATELSSRRMWLDLRWTPRELNTEADDITNEIYDKVGPSLRLPITWDIFPKDVIELVLQHYSELEDEVRLRRISRRISDAAPVLQRKIRRKKEPWG